MYILFHHVVLQGEIKHLNAKTKCKKWGRGRQAKEMEKFCWASTRPSTEGDQTVVINLKSLSKVAEDLRCDTQANVSCIGSHSNTPQVHQGLESHGGTCGS